MPRSFPGSISSSRSLHSRKIENMPFTNHETHRLGGKASHAKRTAAERREYARALVAKRWAKNKTARVDEQSARAENIGYGDVLSISSIERKEKRKDDGTE